MNLIVEIGNTALKAAWTDGLTLGKTFRYQGERTVDYIISLTKKEKPKVMTLACVSSLSSVDEKRLRGECGDLILLDPGKKDLALQYSFPSYLSYDRFSSLIAARYMFKDRPCTIIDFGTTLTVDFIDKDGNYEGGNISLGCRTRFKALNRYSKTLPLVDTPENIEKEGHSLKESIESGVISGIMFEIQAYIDSHPDNVVVFTGGDANYFVKKIKNSIFVVCNLVLMGLALITNDFVNEKTI